MTKHGTSHFVVTAVTHRTPTPVENYTLGVTTAGATGSMATPVGGLNKKTPVTGPVSAAVVASAATPPF